jgi:hypothetical protein
MRQLSCFSNFHFLSEFSVKVTRFVSLVFAHFSSLPFRPISAFRKFYQQFGTLSTCLGFLGTIFDPIESDIVGI